MEEMIEQSTAEAPIPYEGSQARKAGGEGGIQLTDAPACAVCGGGVGQPKAVDKLRRFCRLWKRLLTLPSVSYILGRHTARAVKTAFLFFLFSTVAFASDRFTQLSLPEHAQIQIGHFDYGHEDWKVVVSKGVETWHLMIHRNTHPKEPIYIPLSEEAAKNLIVEGVTLLHEFTFSRKGYEPNDNESTPCIRLRALSGREIMEVTYYRSATKDRYPKLEELLSKISKLIPDKYIQYRFK